MARREHITGRETMSERAGVDPVPRSAADELAELSGSCVLWPVVDGRTPAIVQTAALREMDRLALSEFGMPTLLLMENAGACLAAHAKRLLSLGPEMSDGAPFRAVILAGKGNNGGDGCVMARHLVNAGWRVAIVLSAEVDQYSGDAATNLGICRRMGMPCVVASSGGAWRALREAMRAANGRPPEASGRATDSATAQDSAAADAETDAQAGLDLIVDAVLGTGLTGAVRGVPRELIEALNDVREAPREPTATATPSATPPASSPPTDIHQDRESPASRKGDAGRDAAGPRPLVLAVDVPSGMDAETGRASSPGGPVVRADLTVSLVGMKPGYVNLDAQRYLGRVVVGDIGMPAPLVQRFAAACDDLRRPGEAKAGRTNPARPSYRRGD